MVDASHYELIFKTLESGDIHDLVQVFAQINGGPVFLADRGLNLISLYPKQPIQEKIFDTLLTDKKLSDELTVECQKFYLSGTSGTYEPFYVDTDPDGTYNPRVLVEVHQKSKVYGHLVIYLHHREFCDTDLALAKLFAQASLIKLSQSSSFTYSASSALETWLGPELPKDTSVLAKPIEELLGNTLLMLVAPIPVRTKDQSFAHFVVSTINEQYADTIACMPGQHVVMLKRIPPELPDRTKLLAYSEKIRKLLGKFDLTLACTDPFVGYTHIRDYYELTKLTLKREKSERGDSLDTPDSRKLSKILFCSDYLPEQLYYQIILTGKSSLYIPHVIKRMYCEQKSENGLFASLKQYYLNFGNIDKAAEEVHVHRNTLLYRLKRIQDLYGLDYKDTSIMRKMYTAFELIACSDGREGLWMS